MSRNAIAYEIVNTSIQRAGNSTHVSYLLYVLYPFCARDKTQLLVIAIDVRCVFYAVTLHYNRMACGMR